MNKKKKSVSKKLETTKVVKSYDIYRIDWFDHVTGNHRWMHDDEVESDSPICTTIGVKVHENKKTITLAQNLSSLQHIADTTTIIKSCIDDKVKLGEIKYAKKD